MTVPSAGLTAPPVNVGRPAGSQGDLARTLGFWSATSLLVGTIIGSGIFRTPSSIAATIHDPLPILGLWLFFGIVTLCGALTLAELATMLPKTGGTYVYLRAAYGDRAAFVFGWIYLIVAIPSGLAASAVFFAELVVGLQGHPAESAGWTVPLAAVAVIVFLSAVNMIGIRYGSGLQNIFTLIKVGALLAIIVCAFASGRGNFSHWWAAPEYSPGGGSIWDAVKSVMFTYNGWIYISLVAGEVKNPETRLKSIILSGAGAVVLLYLGANLAYLYVMPLSAMPGTIVAKEAMTRIAGPMAGTIIGCCIMASVFGGLNGVILTKARVAYAMARDGLTFRFLGKMDPVRGTPARSILVQGLCAIGLALILCEPAHPLRLFDRLIACFALFEWLALLFAIGAVFVLRKKHPDWPRRFRTPGYPLVPLFFVLGTSVGLAAMLWSAYTQGDYAPWAALALLLLGIPVYSVWRRGAPVTSAATG